MKCTTAKLSGIAIAALLMTSADARADLIHWSYSWSITPSSVESGSSSITIADESLHHVVGNSRIVSTTLQTTSTASYCNPDTFNNKPYVLSLTVIDDASGQHATFNYSGVFNGTVSKYEPNIDTTLDPLTIQSAVLAGIKFTASPAYFCRPCQETPCDAGSINVHVTVELPEPRSLFLAGLGAILIGLVSTRNRWNRFPLLPA